MRTDQHTWRITQGHLIGSFLGVEEVVARRIQVANTMLNIRLRNFKLSSQSGTLCTMQVCLICHVLRMFFINEKQGNTHTLTVYIYMIDAQPVRRGQPLLVEKR
jgi:hypothetical protein